MCEYGLLSHMAPMFPRASKRPSLPAALSEFQFRYPRDWPNLTRWFDAMEERPTYLGTKSDYYTHVHDLPPQLGGEHPRLITCASVSYLSQVGVQGFNLVSFISPTFIFPTFISASILCVRVRACICGTSGTTNCCPLLVLVLHMLECHVMYIAPDW